VYKADDILFHYNDILIYYTKLETHIHYLELTLAKFTV